MNLTFKRVTVLAVAGLLIATLGVGVAGEPVTLTHDWPGYTGPDGLLAGKSTVPMLEDFGKARLAWVNEQADLGYAKTTSGGGHCYPKEMKPSGCGSLIVADGLVLLGYFNPHDELIADDIVVAVDAATGRTRWKQVYAGQGLNRGARKHPIFGTIPVAGDGKIFHLGSGGLVYALDLKTGERLWQADVGKYRKDLVAVLDRTETRPAAERAREVGKWWPYAMRAPLQVVDGPAGGGASVLLVPFGPWAAKDRHNPPKTPEENEARKRARLFAFDAATGKPLWNLVDGVAEGNTACVVKLGDKTYALTASKFGMLRLIAPRTGKVLWEKFLGVSHGWQPVVVDGRAFVMAARKPKPGVFEGEAFLTAYALSATGAKRVWQSASPFYGAMYWSPPAYRAGVLYARLKGGVYALDAATGKELGRLSGSWLFHLWGDRLVIPGDVNHESMNFPCTYTAVTGDLANLALSGKPFAFRHQPPYRGVCGYEVLMHHPFVDGYLFTRAIDTQRAVGVILCWDLRANSEPRAEGRGLLEQKREEYRAYVHEKARAQKAAAEEKARAKKAAADALRDELFDESLRRLED